MNDSDITHIVTPPIDNRLGLPEMTEDEIREEIEAQPDVKKLIKFERYDPNNPKSLWRYLVETTFLTFPRFVIGRVDDRFNVTRDFKCGLKSSALAEWERGKE